LELAAELGVKTFPQFHEGEKLLVRGGRRKTYRGTIPALPIWSLLELELTIRRIDFLARRVDPDEPWSHPRARQFDSMTVTTWLDRHVRSSGARMTLVAAIRAVFVCEPAELSMLYLLFYVRAAGGLMALVEIPGGAQQDRFVGGAQQLSQRMAEEVDVRLEHRVRGIEWSTDAVTAVTSEGRFEARRCVVAMAPALAGQIEWDPPLGSVREQLMQRMPMGSVIKCVAAYDKPFWRDEGLSGEVVTDGAPTQIVFDDSAPELAQGALVGFITGDAARRWSGANDVARRSAVLNQWAELFGGLARTPIEYVDRDWNADPWSRGCYVGLMAPGTMTSLGPALRAPIGPIHWAGTETATEWAGYFEGALQAGERAADEILGR
jgi:monoamine oxidase